MCFFVHGFTVYRVWGLRVYRVQGVDVSISLSPDLA